MYLEIPTLVCEHLHVVFLLFVSSLSRNSLLYFLSILIY